MLHGFQMLVNQAQQVGFVESLVIAVLTEKVLQSPARLESNLTVHGLNQDLQKVASPVLLLVLTSPRFEFIFELEREIEFLLSRIDATGQIDGGRWLRS